jgi:hypothetical protein
MINQELLGTAYHGFCVDFALKDCAQSGGHFVGIVLSDEMKTGF